MHLDFVIGVTFKNDLSVRGEGISFNIEKVGCPVAGG